MTISIDPGASLAGVHDIRIKLQDDSVNKLTKYYKISILIMEAEILSTDKS